jgi:ribosomal protein S18 acetylase RimI-like enzyme
MPRLEEPTMQNPRPTELEPVVVRRLRPSDLEAVTAVDARIVGRRRDEYFKVKLAMARSETGIEVSLAAELDGMFTGFLIARVFYGEFGRMEPVAVLEVMGVHPDFRGRGVGHALVRQLTTNLLGLGVGRIATEVAWEDQSMLAFFHREGFAPAPRLCLDLDCREARRRDEERAP